MPTRSQPLYQGRDWVSERWSAALTYDALDKIYDLCLYQTKGQPSSLFKGQLPLFSLLMDHIDIVQKGLLHLEGEVIPTGHVFHKLKLGWSVFEIQQLEKSLYILLTDLSGPDEKKTLQEIMTLTTTMKRHIRNIDQ